MASELRLPLCGTDEQMIVGSLQQLFFICTSLVVVLGPVDQALVELWQTAFIVDFCFDLLGGSFSGGTDSGLAFLDEVFYTLVLHFFGSLDEA